MAIKVKDLLKEKGSQVWTIDVDATIKEALLLMAEKQIGAIPVMEEGHIRGMFSERDYVNYVAATGLAGTHEPVRKIMVHPVFFVDPEQTCAECMSLITAKNIRHIPVVENDELVGMITVGDILHELIRQQDGLIENLKYFAWKNIIG
ncbi:MAG: CBS domain-containing protein [Chloroflexi bacterium]|nr:CBS domain-containing protein [Chloroflexota bacterium]